MGMINDPGFGAGPVGPPGLPFPIPPGGLDISTLPDDFELPPGFDFKTLPPGAIKGKRSKQKILPWTLIIQTWLNLLGILDMI